MDVDISDILASVSRPSAAHLTTADTSTSTDHQLLTRAWTTERCSPSLSPYPTELLSRITTRIRAQISKIEDFSSGITPTPINGPPPTNLNLTLSILQTDLSRTQFLLRSLLRCRLQKISKHATFYLSALSADTKQMLLSESETQFLRHHQALLSGFYEASFLGSFPKQLRRLDDRVGGGGGEGGMVEGPDVEMAVVVRCVGEEWGNEGLRDDGSVGVELRLKRGQVLVGRWGDVEMGVRKGDLEML